MEIASLRCCCARNDELSAGRIGINMRIALLSEKYPPDPGGLAVSVQRLAQGLIAAGHTVCVCAPNDTPELRRAIDDDVEVLRLPLFRRGDDTLAEWFSLLAAQHAAQPFAVIHAYFVTQLAFVGVYAGRTLGVPTIVSARGNDLDRAVFDAAKSAQILYALQHANAITANSRDLIRKAQALVPTRSAILIPNGVDAAHYRSLPRDESLAQSLGLANRSVIGFVGEARSKKGLASLLIAYRSVAQRRSAALLLVGGVRRDDKELLKVFQKQQPDLPVIVVPYTTSDMLPAYYNLIDVLALPSLRDGLPNALLEGMACERAIVGTAVGGIPDAIVDGENGRLVPPGDVDALAQAMDDLLADTELRRCLGRHARETILRDFTLEQELEKNLTLYRDLV
jgi:glycosyltransferase involved in cell wall biosynthesis